MTAINIAVGEAYVALWKKVSYSRLLAWGWGILAVGGAVIIFASHFGFLFFDRVRPSLGGGFPTRIQLVLSQETSKDLNGVLPLNGNRTDPVYLIYETSSDLMIAIDLKSLEGRVIRIPRNGVAAVLGENVMQTPAPQMNMNPASGTQ